MLRIVSLFVLALGACAAPAPASWHRADAGPSDLARDRAECRSMGQAWGVSNAAALYAIWKNDQVFADCMVGKGWAQD